MTKQTTAVIDPEALPATAATLLERGHRLALVAATHRGPDDERGEAMHAAYLFLAANPDSRAELIVELDPGKPELPSLAHLSFPASRFEREMRDQFGITGQRASIEANGLVVGDAHPQLVTHGARPGSRRPSASAGSCRAKH